MGNPTKTTKKMPASSAGTSDRGGKKREDGYEEFRM
jgi:hypothetical protein